MQSLLDIIKYNPVQPGFGTSGVRALVEDLTDLEMFCLVKGTILYFQSHHLLFSKYDNDQTLKIPVACDLRPSSPRLTQACICAVHACGFEAQFVGQVPTPALTSYALEKEVASFMITGSHIPLDRNGIKANRCDGEVMKSDEAGITASVNEVRDTVLQGAAQDSLFNQFGMFKPEHRTDLPKVSEAAARHYINRYQTVFPDGSLSGLRIVFFEYSAVGRDLLPAILRMAGAEVICMARSDEFFPIDTEAISDQHLLELGELVKQAQSEHGRIDALVSTDGDSDRPLVLAVNESDVNGVLQFIPGDKLGLLTADYLGVDSVSVPVSSNPLIMDYFSRQNIPVQLTRIGSPYVIESMLSAKRYDLKQRIVAWEANGGFLMGSDFRINEQKLTALPTRDAILPILSVLSLVAQSGRTLTEIVNDLPPRYGKAGLIDEFPKSSSLKLLQKLTPEFDHSVIDIRFDSTTIVFIDRDQQIIGQCSRVSERAADLLAIKAMLESFFSQELRFAQVTQINYLDGVRCYFNNGEIVHIRPSGNAPQLRLYAYADTQQRADEIVSLGIAEPDGLLKQLASSR